MKHKPVDPRVAENLDTLMGIDISKRREEKLPQDVKPETADGISNLMGISVQPTSHERQLRGREGYGDKNSSKADAILGADVSSGRSRDDSQESVKGKAKKVLGV